MKIDIMKYFGIASVLCFGAMATSCEDYLDVSPDSSFSAEEIFSSETETKAMLNTIYTYLTNNNLYGNNFPYAFDTNTDVEMRSSVTELSTSGNGDEVHCFDMQPIWNSLENTWNQAYKTINYCNDFLENMEGSGLFSKEVGVDGPTEMQHMYGEVRCLRAMVYFDLIRTWGDVPFRTKSTETTDNFYGEGVTDRDQIYEYLINDLIDAEQYMKYAADIQEGVERASREYCQGLIGQLALYRGGYSLRPGGELGIMERRDDYQDYYKIAQTYLGKLINEGRHSLTTESFEQLWHNECNYIVTNNGDVIFEVPMLAESSSNLGYRIGVTIGYNTDKPAHSYGGATNRVTLCGLYPFTFDSRDLRLDVTCVPIKYAEDLQPQINFNGNKCVCSWSIGKWSKLYMSTPMKSSAGNTGINSIRLRYADVLLMYAEVLNELYGPTAEAKDALKAVRTRAFEAADRAEMVEDYVNNLTTKDEFFQAIYNERAWEFGGEGVRKYDLARWNLYGKTIHETFDKFLDWGHRANGEGVKGEVRDYVWYLEEKDANEKVTNITFMGLKEPLTGEEDHPASQGWKRTGYATEWWHLDTELGEFMAPDNLKWSFRNYINWKNYEGFDDAAHTLRYIAPYPTAIITSHRGSIQQYYGYR